MREILNSIQLHLLCIAMTQELRKAATYLGSFMGSFKATEKGNASFRDIDCECRIPETVFE
jgi:hypothetical protein